MERADIRWVIPGAAAMLQMHVIKLRGNFEEYWQFHKDQEQARLYGDFEWNVLNEK
jgi:hypothetical protein